MARSEKVSISLDGEALKWLRRRARRTGTSVSAVVAEAARMLQQSEARDALVKRFEREDGPFDEAELEAIREEWRTAR
jgi:Arc/MetJ-type ribon-helix-helix transcriptional regulator